MDDNGFAALVASVIVSERRIGNKPSLDDPRNWISQFAEDAVAAFGCTVSGYEIKDAVDRRDWSDFFQYLFNMEIPENDGIRQWASVGIGNIKLNTAADLWLGQWDLGPLQVTNVFGQDVDIENPFAAHATCTAMFGGSCETYQPTEVESYRLLTRQLLNRKINVEYVAGNLEVGALRAMSLGLRPSAFNSASWHLRGLQTDKEIIDSRWNPGGAIYIVDDIPTALDVLGLTSTWNLSTEPQYAYHMARQSK